MPGPRRALAYNNATERVWNDIQQALCDPGIVEEGDVAPSNPAISELKELIYATGSIVPLVSPHVECFEGSVRLIWNTPLKNVRAIKASRVDRRSYLYHEEVANGLAFNEGIADLTADNLAHWLKAMD